MFYSLQFNSGINFKLKLKISSVLNARSFEVLMKLNASAVPPSLSIDLQEFLKVGVLEFPTLKIIIIFLFTMCTCLIYKFGGLTKELE